MAVEAIRVKVMIHNRERERVVPVGSRPLQMVIDYCNYQAKLKMEKKKMDAANKPEEEKAFDEMEEEANKPEEKRVLDEMEEEVNKTEENIALNEIEEAANKPEEKANMSICEDDDGEMEEEEEEEEESEAEDSYGPYSPKAQMLADLLLGEVKADSSIVDKIVIQWVQDLLQLGQGMLFEVITVLLASQ